MSDNKSTFNNTVVNSNIGSVSQGDGHFRNLRPLRSEGGPSDHAQIESFIGGKYVGAPFRKGDKVIVKDDGVYEDTPSIKGLVFTVWSVPVEVPTGSGKKVWICSIVDEALPISKRTEYGVVASILEHWVPGMFRVGQGVKISAHGTPRTHVIGLFKDDGLLWKFNWIPVGEVSAVHAKEQLQGEIYCLISISNHHTKVLIAERDLEESELWDFDTDTST